MSPIRIPWSTPWVPDPPLICRLAFDNFFFFVRLRHFVFMKQPTDVYTHKGRSPKTNLEFPMSKVDSRYLETDKIFVSVVSQVFCSVLRLQLWRMFPVLDLLRRSTHLTTTVSLSTTHPKRINELISETLQFTGQDVLCTFRSIIV